MVTIKDIAKELGISINTVSRALNNKPDVASKTREHVLETAKKLGYVPNTLARSLVAGETCTIGFICSDLVNPFYARIAQGVEETAREAGYTTIIASTNEDDTTERQAVDLMRSKRVDGIVISPTQQSHDHISRLIQENIPFILVNRHIDEFQTAYVINNNQHGAYLAVQHLVSLGHKHITHITGPLRISSVKERINGYRQALQKNDIPYDTNLVIHTDLTLECGYQTTLNLLKRNKMPSAIFAYSDHLAIGAIKAIRELGLSIPENISLAGYDDIEYAQFLDIPLTTVRQPMYEIGQRAINHLIEIIQSDDYQPKEHQEILEPDLIIRESTGRANV
jgi:LacI family transcriptional regulator